LGIRSHIHFPPGYELVNDGPGQLEIQLEAGGEVFKEGHVDFLDMFRQEASGPAQTVTALEES
jgi:hypothetical protein